jgi:four helix bundle protein
LDLAVEFCEKTRDLKIEGHFREQLLRASASIPLNLAEGNAKGTVNDKRRFFQMAFGSVRECQVIFRILKLKDHECTQIADRLGGALYKLIRSQIKPFPTSDI